ncbi:protein CHLORORESPIRATORY REDUCTION 41, chloroplastic-like [Phragmites australis]|uniref:protein CHLORORESPIRATORY REDUCTION 41, chloroplastic-like n=1 Tax=Phragmites australis TaxID=29695 RepID=UPI002D781875|nr:protein CHLORORESPIRATORY REDUCTION 41, chloroplastic-like [Phragmites australis]
MAASFLRPLLPPKPFLSARKPRLLAAPATTTAVRCTVAPKPTTSTPKPNQEETKNREQQVQEPNGAATPDEANPNPNSIPDDETPPSATVTTTFAVARRLPSAITPDRRRRTALTQEEPPNYEIGWKRTKKLPLEKPRGWAIADFLEKLEGLMARERYGSGQLLVTVAGVVTERAREEAEILVAEGGVEERVITELFRVLRLVEMDVEMVKAAVKEETVKERVETARARCRQAILVALSL